MIIDNSVYKNGTSKGNIKYYISYRPEHKLEYTDETGRKIILRRIVAKKDIIIGDKQTGKLITSGTIGGYVESGKNFSQFGNCWIDKSCIVYGDAHIKDDVYVIKDCVVSGKALISGAGIISNSIISGEAQIHNGDIDSSIISDQAILHSSKHFSNFSIVVNNSSINKKAQVINSSPRTSITINKSHITDCSEVRVQPQSVESYKRIYINSTNIEGMSKISINNPTSPPPQNTNGQLERLIFMDNCTVSDSQLILNQSHQLLSAKNTYLNNQNVILEEKFTNSFFNDSTSTQAQLSQ